MTILPLSRAILEDVSILEFEAQIEFETSSKIALDKGKMVMVKPLDYVPEYFNIDTIIMMVKNYWIVFCILRSTKLHTPLWVVKNSKYNLGHVCFYYILTYDNILLLIYGRSNQDKLAQSIVEQTDVR